MNDKDKIKFAIRYLKKGLKSKRTPPLYEELMNELGFEKKDKVNNLISIAELKQQIEKMKSDVELARDNANKTEDWGTFSVLNSILDDWEKVE